jgi:hypothetical protein
MHMRVLRKNVVSTTVLGTLGAAVLMTTGIAQARTPVPPVIADQAHAYRVGVDVAPGIYRSNGGPACNWEIDRMVSAGPIVRAKGGWDAGPQTIVVSQSDYSAKSHDCGPWSLVGSEPSSSPSSAFPVTPFNPVHIPMVPMPTTVSPSGTQGSTPSTTAPSSTRIASVPGSSRVVSGIHSGSGS